VVGHHKALSTLSQKSETVAENGEIRRLSHFSATVWTGFKKQISVIIIIVLIQRTTTTLPRQLG